jgi:hypothetical protein
MNHVGPVPAPPWEPPAAVAIRSQRAREDALWSRFYDRALREGRTPEAARDFANARLEMALADR